MTFKIPEEKKAKIKDLMIKVASLQRVKVKLLAKLLGTLQSVSLATGPLVQVVFDKV